MYTKYCTIIFQGFSGCGGRFEHQLTGDPYHLADATTCGSRVLRFYTLGKLYCNAKTGEGVHNCTLFRLDRKI